MTPDEIKTECWQRAHFCLSTHYIFRRKSEKYERYIRYNTLLGVLTPILLGAMVATYGATGIVYKWLIIATSPFSVLQAVLSGIAVVNKWDSLLSYSIESMTANRIQYNKFIDLAQYPPSNQAEFERQYRELTLIDSEREAQDEKISFSREEERIGTRYAHWMRQSPCVTCKEVPQTMSPSKCDTCGTKNWFKLLFIK